MINSDTLLFTQELDLRSNHISNIEGFYGLQYLNWLSLSSNNLTNLNGFPELPQLRYLGLFANFLSETPIEELLSEIKLRSPKITHVFILGNLYDDKLILQNQVFEKCQISNSCISNT